MNHPSHRADPRPAQLDRRDFLRVAAGLTLAGTVPESLLADPYAPRTRALPSAFRSAALDPVRVRGRVVAARRGLAGVGISDGRDVIQTDREGRFEFKDLGPYTFRIRAGGDDSSVYPTGDPVVVVAGRSDAEVIVAQGVPLIGKLNGPKPEWVVATSTDVRFENLQWTTQPRDGEFRFEGLPPGRIRLTVQVNHDQIDVGTFDTSDVALEITVPEKK